MNIKNILLCGLSLATFSLMGGPFESALDEMLDKTQGYFSDLQSDLSESAINLAYSEMEKTRQELKKLKIDGRIGIEIMSIKRDICFLNDLKKYLANQLSKEEMNKWADCSSRYIYIVLNAFAITKK